MPSEIRIDYKSDVVDEVTFVGGRPWDVVVNNGPHSSDPDTVDFSKAELSTNAVDLILLAYAGSDWGPGKTLNLKGNGNAKPSKVGRGYRKELLGRGVRVFTN